MVPGWRRPAWLLVALIVASPAGAQAPINNVSGFDASQLAGKTCLRTFSTGGSCDECLGANIMRFEIRGDMLVARQWRRFGRAAYDKAGYETTKSDWTADTTGFDDQGELRDLTVQGTTIRFVTSEGAATTLTYAADGKLSGIVDPRPVRRYLAQTLGACR